MRITRLMALTLAVVPATPVSAQRSLVAIFAHPDDERIVGPILARYAREGNNVYLVVATDGAKGVTAHAKTPAGDSLVAIRAEETRCATRTLGIKPPILLGHPDGGLASFAVLDSLRRDLVRLITQFRPDAILTACRCRELPEEARPGRRAIQPPWIMRTTATRYLAPIWIVA